MMRRHTVAAVGLLVLAAAPTRARAQDVTGSLNGRLVRPDSTPLAEAVIVVSGASLQQPATAHSDARGNFRVLQLPVGEYAVHIRSVGFRPVTFQCVLVSLGRATSLGLVAMEDVAIDLSEIVVTAQVTAIDLASASSGTNLRADELSGLPLNRDLNSFIALAPQAIYQQPDIAFQSEGVNIAGGTVSDNAFFVDGMNVTNPASATTGFNLPYNFVQEVQVRTGGYEAEYGRALSGIVNVVTPSGGNDVRGQLFTFFSNDALTTAARYGLIQTNLDKYSRFDVGGFLSGPISRDHLWFFAAYNPIIDVRQASYAGIAPQDDRQTQHRFAAKLTWQPAPVLRLTLTGTGDPAVHDGVAPIADWGAPKAVQNADVVLGYRHQGGYGVSLRNELQANQNLLVVFMAQRSEYRDDFDPQTALGRTAPRYTDSLGAWSGGYGGSGRTSLRRVELQASALATLGSHMAKAGLEFEENTLDDHVDEYTTGFIEQDGANSYTWTRSYDTSLVHNRVLTGYLQDSWGISGRIRLNAGLRLESQRLIGNPGAAIQPLNLEIAPRLGVIVSPGRVGTQKLYASFGRFYEQVPLQALAEWYGNSVVSYVGYTHDPRGDTTGATPLGSVGALVAPVPRTNDLNGEYYSEVTLGYERRVGARASASLRFIHRWLGSVLEDTQDSIGAITVGNPGRGAPLFDSMPMPTHQYDALELTLRSAAPGALQYLVSYVLSRDWGNYDGLWVGDGEPANATYYADTRDAAAISNGLLRSDRTHVFKALGSYRFGIGLTAGLSSWWQSGTPLNELFPTLHYSLGYATPRGTAGRSPATWDLNVRLEQELPHGASAIIDVQHVGSPRRAVAISQGAFRGHDPSGNPTSPNPSYGSVLVYQLPMSARVGFIARF